MSLSKPGNAKELRAALHAIYEPYAQGEVTFPRARVNPLLAAALPDKTQPIANALLRTWKHIDFDREMHRALVDRVLEDPKTALTQEDGSPAKGMVVSKIGSNALKEVVFTPV